MEEINAKTQGRKDAKDRGSPVEIQAVSVVDLSGCFIEGTLAMARTQYRQIDILIMLEKIGFEWFSAHAEGFLKAVLGASLPVKGQVSCSALEHSGNHWIFRLTGQLELLPYSFAEYQEMQLHQCPDLTVLGLRPSATHR